MEVIGLMSGSSLDGIDLAYVRFDEEPLRYVLINKKTYALPKELKDDLAKATHLFAFGLAKLESKYSQFIAKTINEFKDEFKISDAIIGIHGHTVLHLPEIQTSWQLINGGQVAMLTNQPVVCDFRNQDLAISGQGTPMAVLADRDLFKGYEYYINLGGIANISYQQNETWSAYDLCPCNQLLNYFSNKLNLDYDPAGKHAAEGQVYRGLLDYLNGMEYFKKQPPKSIDNTWVKEIVIKSMLKYKLSPEDFLRTCVEFIADVIANNCTERNKKALFTGGGTKNSFLMDTIKSKLAQKTIDCAIPSLDLIDYKESILIAYATYLRWIKKPNFIASATGAKHDVIGGAIYLN